jgi:hypothetical protein
MDEDNECLPEISQRWDMGYTYKNATLTIVAAKATGVECGFLEPQRPLEVCIFPLCLPGGNSRVNIRSEAIQSMGQTLLAQVEGGIILPGMSTTGVLTVARPANLWSTENDMEMPTSIITGR